MYKVKTKNSEGFSGRNQKFKRFFQLRRQSQKKRSPLKFREFSGRNQKFKQFFRPKTGDLKKKGSHPKNVMKSGVSPQKYRWQTPTWASICTPVAPSLLISSGHSPSLGGHKQSFGGHGHGMPSRGAGPANRQSRSVCLFYCLHFLNNQPKNNSCCQGRLQIPHL